MNILIATGLYPPQMGGPATYSKLLKEELPKHGYEVVVVNFGGYLGYPKVVRHFLYFLRLLREGIHSDLIIALDPVSVGLPALVVSKILKKKLILKIVGDYAWEQGTQRYGVKDLLDEFVAKYFQYSFKIRTLKRIQFYVAKHADKIIVPSNYLKNIVIKWGVDDKKIKVIYNAFFPVEIGDTKETAKEKLKLEGKILLSVGRLVPWKGFKPLIEIMLDLQKKFPNLTLLIIGNGPNKLELESTIDKLGLASKVRLIRALPREEHYLYIKAADIFVLNTGYEGFSHQILEVMSIGTPIVTTNVGGNPEMITDNESGLLVEYNNKEELRRSIEELLLDDVKADKMTKRARAKSQDFDVSVMIKELIKELQ